MKLGWLNFFKRRKTITVESLPDFNPLYHDNKIDTGEFCSNLIRTINWTSRIIESIDDTTEIDYSRVLRSFNPAYGEGSFYTYDSPEFGFASSPDIPFNYALVLEQAMALRPDNNLPNGNIDQLGKILEFDIDVTTHDGAPVAESEGFVDESDIPPIDTWFYLTKSYLYCWIPARFVNIMQNAIDVEIFGSYRWIRDSNPYFHIEVMRRIKSMG